MRRLGGDDDDAEAPPNPMGDGFDGVFGGDEDNPLGMFGESTSMLPKGVLEDDSFDDPADGDEGDMQWMDLPDDLQEQSPIIDGGFGDACARAMPTAWLIHLLFSCCPPGVVSVVSQASRAAGS